MSFKGDLVVGSIVFTGVILALTMAIPQIGFFEFWGTVLGFLWDFPFLLVIVGTFVVAGLVSDRV